MSTMEIYEVVGAGFDASSDATDDRVLWVKALSRRHVEVGISGIGATCAPLQIANHEDDVDFVLPRDVVALRARLYNFRDQRA